MKDGHDILGFLPVHISEMLRKKNIICDISVSEIRLSAGAPVSVRCRSENRFIRYDGEIVNDTTDAVICRKEDIDYCFGVICDFSVYSYENEISQGFITLPGGHRVGICGKAVLSEDGIKTIDDISSLNFRIARQMTGCSDRICEKIKSSFPCGILITGAPSSGKTTFLRDLCRNLSYSYRISLIDERQEIAASFRGVPQNDVGPCSDVFSGYPRDKAAETAIRVMSPDILICDEIGNDKDIEVLHKAVNTGVRIIASVHAGSLSELKNKKWIMDMIKSGHFRFIIFMDCLSWNPVVFDADNGNFI